MTISKIGLGAVIGIAILLGLVMLGDAAHLLPVLPSNAGEDDFATRITYFLWIAVPGFSIFGALIMASNAGASVIAWRFFGMAAASICYLLLVKFALREIPVSPEAANQVFLFILLIWIALGFACLLILMLRHS